MGSIGFQVGGPVEEDGIIALYQGIEGSPGDGEDGVLGSGNRVLAGGDGDGVVWWGVGRCEVSGDETRSRVEDRIDCIGRSGAPVVEECEGSVGKVDVG